MSNRFHTKPRTTTVSADEINLLLNPNNTGASHDTIRHDLCGNDKVKRRKDPQQHDACVQRFR